MNASRTRLYALDCLKGIGKLLDTGTVDVVVTSPPYNLGVDYGKFDDTMPRAEYLDWIEKVCSELGRVLSAEGSFFLNIGQKPSDPWVAWEVAFRLRRHFVLQNVIVWLKSIAIQPDDLGKDSAAAGGLTIGHFKPIAGDRFLNDAFEYVFHFTKTGEVQLDRLAVGVPYQDKSNIGRWKSAAGDVRCRGNVWFIPYETIQDRARERPHPASFPVKLPLMCIRLHGVARTRLVLDPFMGIGSTAIACIRLGVPFIGFEIDEGYVKVAEERIRHERALQANKAA